jgi:uncharacterized membrane protein
MKCPNCNATVDLTVKKYFKSFLGIHFCDSCSTKFKLQRKYKYYIWILVSIPFALLSSYFIANLEIQENSKNLAFSLWLIVLFLIYTYMDRKIENKLPTIKVK